MFSANIGSRWAQMVDIGKLRLAWVRYSKLEVGLGLKNIVWLHLCNYVFFAKRADCEMGWSKCFK